MIKIVHLITGVEVIGQVTDNQDYYTISYPAEVKIIMDEDGKQKNFVGPYASFVKGHTIHVNKTKILFVGDPLASLLDYYEETVLGKSPLESDEAKNAASFKLDEEQTKQLEETASE